MRIQSACRFRLMGFATYVAMFVLLANGAKRRFSKGSGSLEGLTVCAMWRQARQGARGWGYVIALTAVIRATRCTSYRDLQQIMGIASGPRGRCMCCAVVVLKRILCYGDFLPRRQLEIPARGNSITSERAVDTSKTAQV
jgi:hypothetical protein